MPNVKRFVVTYTNAGRREQAGAGCDTRAEAEDVAEILKFQGATNVRIRDMEAVSTFVPARRRHGGARGK